MYIHRYADRYNKALFHRQNNIQMPSKRAKFRKKVGM